MFLGRLVHLRRGFGILPRSIRARIQGRFPRPRVLAMGLLLALLAPAPIGVAQRPIKPSLNDFALQWALGRFANPIVCVLEGAPARGLRRLHIEPGPKAIQPAVGRLSFEDLDADEATRCFTELGQTAPNLIGSLDFRHKTTRPRDTAQRDFKSELRRHNGFEYQIISGKLMVMEVREGEDPVEMLDFKGGVLRLHTARKGSDAARLLADLPSPRKFTLEIETRSGRRFSLPIAQAKPQAGP
jgi:hypothetical protein